MTQSVAHFCSQCGSAAIDFSALVGGNATCRGCGWVGPTSSLVTHEFTHSFRDGEEALAYMVNDLRRVYATQVVAEFLDKWGFIVPGDKAAMAKTLSRYVVAMALASLKAVFDERERVERESRGN